MDYSNEVGKGTLHAVMGIKARSSLTYQCVRHHYHTLVDY